MFDLKSLLKEVGAKEKTERRGALIAIAEEDIKWLPQDKTEIMCHIGLTKYQLYWLMWRVRVHLKSYEHFEWSEMKDVLQIVLTMLETEWQKCQSSSAPSVVESSACSKEQTADSASATTGSLLMSHS